MNAPDNDVLIVGGGIAGKTLAALLSSGGLSCRVIEAGSGSPAAGPDPRALAITHASRRILLAIQVWQDLPQDRVGRFQGMHVWDENGSGEIDFDSDELCLDTLGYIVEQSVLQAGLEKAVRAMPGVSVRYNATLTDIHWRDGAVAVETGDGETHSARLLVGADGARSPSRRIAGIRNEIRDYRQKALACIATTERSHEGLARQRFLTDGPLAFLPMYDGRRSGVVWSTRPEHAEELMQMDESGFNRALGDAFEGTLGEIRKSELRTRFDLRGAQAERYCRDRFVLVGDAAHSVHPLAGQGANLGLLDAAALAQLVLQAAGKGRDPGGRRVLRAYERWRKGENRIMMLIFEGFKYTFENQRPPVPALRNRALDFADALRPLKHTIMRRAMGLAGDLPEIARGRFA